MDTIGEVFIVIATCEPYPGVWPFNFASLLFLFLIFGAWPVGQGHIVIKRKQPFRKQQSDVFARGDGSRLVVPEHQSLEGDLARIEAAFVTSEPSSGSPD